MKCPWFTNTSYVLLIPISRRISIPLLKSCRHQWFARMYFYSSQHNYTLSRISANDCVLLPPTHKPSSQSHDTLVMAILSVMRLCACGLSRPLFFFTIMAHSHRCSIRFKSNLRAYLHKKLKTSVLAKIKLEQLNWKRVFLEYLLST